MNEVYVIYKATSPSGKCYIGQSKDFATRLRQHFCVSSGCLKLKRAIKKHGRQNIKFTIILSTANQQVANECERAYIAFYDSIASGYNIKEGGINGRHSEATKQKISINRRGKNRGKRSAEIRRKISIGNKGKKRSDATKQKMSSARKGHKWGVGRKHSAETKRKMSLSAKRRPANRKGTRHTEATKQKLREIALRRYGRT